jgi:hypothetical protein
LAVLGRLKKRRSVGDFDLAVAEDRPGDGEGLEVGREDLGTSLGLEGLDQRVDVDGREEEFVEALVSREEDLGELGAVSDRDLVRDEREETSEELDLGLVGRGGLHSALLGLLDRKRLLIVEAGARVVEVLGEDFGRNPCGEGGGGNGDGDACGRGVEDEGTSGNGTAEEGRHGRRGAAASSTMRDWKLEA